MGKTSETKGDTLQHPSVWMEYDFFAWKDRRQPVWVRTYQCINHYYDNINDDTIQAAEYSDGFGRLLQTRALAEDTIFGDATFGSSGLPADPGTANAPAVGIQRGPNTPVNVRVSGWTVYDNKGRPVEQYEPFFSTSFSYQPVQEAQKGQKARMFYDPRGQVVRTLNPDDSEQRVVFGVPDDLTVPDKYAPTPWEAYTYDANDLSGITHPTESLAYTDHRWTPSNVLVDALGRTKKATSRLAINDLVELSYEYDIRGNVLGITDALGRIVFRHRYNIANQTLWTEHIDAGTKVAVFDVAGKPVHMYDKGKGSVVYSSYDNISRPLKSYARDYATEGFTVRGYIIYGDDPTHGPADPADTNHLGQAYKSYDESGMATVLGFDFKGNPLASTLQVIKDSLLLDAINDGSTSSWDITPYRTDWTETPWDEESALLEGNYRSDTLYDALNRAVQVTLPEDINTDRKVLVPTYNRAGTAEKVTFDGTEYVKLMAYDAKGQLSLAAFNNELMTRYAYDPLTFRLKRVRTERYEYAQTGNTHVYDYLSGNVRQDLVYDYDLVGNILRQTSLAPDSGIDGTLDGADKLVRLFKYDPLYRLLQATGRESTNQSASYTWNEVNPISVSDNALNCRAYTQKYEYDKNGRILRLKHTATGNNYTRKYNYSTNNNRLNSIDNGQSTPTILSSFTYDNNGNQITANSERHYEYDASDMMRAYYNQTSAGVEPTVYAHYVYSGGTRIKKLVRTASNEYESVVYLGPFEYHKKVTASTTEEKNYTNIVGGIEIRTGSFTGDISDTVVYSLGDHLGSVSTRVNSGRTIIDSEEYYPYGDSAMHTTDKKRYRYTGKEKDSESGLYYYGARYYTAWACTFTTVDPAAGSTHYQSSYNYADCNPVVFNDPTGMQTDKPQNTTLQNQNGRIIQDRSTPGLDGQAFVDIDVAFEIYDTEQEKVVGHAIHNITILYHHGENGGIVVDSKKVRDLSHPNSPSTNEEKYNRTFLSEEKLSQSSLDYFASRPGDTGGALSPDVIPEKDSSDNLGANGTSGSKTSQSKQENAMADGNVETTPEASDPYKKIADDTNDNILTPLGLVIGGLTPTFNKFGFNAGYRSTVKVTIPKVINPNKLPKVPGAGPVRNVGIPTPTLKSSTAIKLNTGLNASGRFVGIGALGLSAYSIASDGKITLGEGIKFGINAFGTANPMAGLAIGLIDMGSKAFFGKNATDYLSDWIDEGAESLFEGGISITLPKTLKFWE